MTELESKRASFSLVQEQHEAAAAGKAAGTINRHRGSSSSNFHCKMYPADGALEYGCSEYGAFIQQRVSGRRCVELCRVYVSPHSSSLEQASKNIETEKQRQTIECHSLAGCSK